MRLVLKISEKNDLVRVINIDKLPCKIGRSFENEVVFNDDSISMFHAEISDVEGQIVLKDLDSKNGIYCNGKKFTELILENHKKINFGPALMEVVDIIDTIEKTKTYNYDLKKMGLVNKNDPNEKIIRFLSTPIYNKRRIVYLLPFIVIPLWSEYIKAIMDEESFKRVTWAFLSNFFGITTITVFFSAITRLISGEFKILSLWHHFWKIWIFLILMDPLINIINFNISFEIVNVIIEYCFAVYLIFYCFCPLIKIVYKQAKNKIIILFIGSIFLATIGIIELFEHYSFDNKNYSLTSYDYFPIQLAINKKVTFASLEKKILKSSKKVEKLRLEEIERNNKYNEKDVRNYNPTTKNP